MKQLFTCSITCLDILEFSNPNTYAEAKKNHQSEGLVYEGWACVHIVTAEYLLGSEHLSKHRKQTSITDAETHAVLCQDLQAAQQLMRDQRYPLTRWQTVWTLARRYLRCAEHWRSSLSAARRWVLQNEAESRPGEPGRYNMAERAELQSASPAGWKESHIYRVVMSY